MTDDESGDDRLLHPITVSVRLPDGDTLPVAILVLPSTTVRSLVDIIVENVNNFRNGDSDYHTQLKLRAERVRLLKYDSERKTYVPMHKKDLLQQQHQLKDNDSITLVCSLVDPKSLHRATHSEYKSFGSFGHHLIDEIQYDTYVKEVTVRLSSEGESNVARAFLHRAVNVSVDTDIVVDLAPSDLGVCVHAQSLADIDALAPSTVPDCGDMVKNFGGSVNEAKKRGYISWTGKKFHNKVFLLEVAGEYNQGDLIEKYITHNQAVRYCWNGVNNGYLGGDYDSWQRYTHAMPVDCKITVLDFFNDMWSGRNEGESSIVIKPYQSLQYGTYYALLLQNSVPIVPVDNEQHRRRCDYSIFSDFCHSHTCEDVVYIFKTILKENTEGGN